MGNVDVPESAAKLVRYYRKNSRVIFVGSSVVLWRSYARLRREMEVDEHVAGTY